MRSKRNRTVRIKASQTDTLPEAHRTCKTAQQGRAAMGPTGRGGSCRAWAGFSAPHHGVPVSHPRALCPHAYSRTAGQRPGWPERVLCTFSSCYHVAREARTLLSLRAKQDKLKLSTRPAVSDSMGNRPVSRTSGCSRSIPTPTLCCSAKALRGQCSSGEAHSVPILPEHHCHTGASGFRHTDISSPCLPGQLTHSTSCSTHLRRQMRSPAWTAW